jgi:hypothetical protein
MERYYIQFTFVATFSSFANLHVSADEVSTVFIPLRDKLLEMVHLVSLTVD